MAGHNIFNLEEKVSFVAEACHVSWEYFSIDPDRTPLSHITRGGEPFIPSLRLTYDLDGRNPIPDLGKLFGLNISRNEITEKMRRLLVENRLNLIIGPWLSKLCNAA